MAKGYNPAEAHRKAQKAKEKKKNKTERKSAREEGEAKKSTAGELSKYLPVEHERRSLILTPVPIVYLGLIQVSNERLETCRTKVDTLGRSSLSFSAD